MPGANRRRPRVLDRRQPARTRRRRIAKRGAGRTLETLFHPFIRRLRDLPYPVVTAVNGPAAGAGMSLALMGDLVLCARSAYFLQAFRRIGLVPDCGSTWLLPRLVGRARAIELSLLGERLPAETALAWGLVNRVFDDEALMGETLRLAHELANGPTVALGLIRRLYWESPQNSFEQQLDLECRSQRLAGAYGGFSRRREGILGEAAGQIRRRLRNPFPGRRGCEGPQLPAVTLKARKALRCDSQGE